MTPPADLTLLGVMATALVSALGTIGLVTKALVDARRRRNGHAELTRAEFEAAIRDLKEKIDELAVSFRDFRRMSHDRWDKLNPVPGTLELLWKRVDRLEGERPR